MKRFTANIWLPERLYSVSPLLAVVAGTFFMLFSSGMAGTSCGIGLYGYAIWVMVRRFGG